MTSRDLLFSAMAEDEAMRAPKAARLERQDAEDFRKLGELNPLKHLLPDVMRAEQAAQAKRVREEQP